MTERLNMPTQTMTKQTMPVQSWRPQRRESSLDPQMMRMALVAGGVVAVLGLGYAGFAVVNRGPRTVPVIEADSRPVRVRPDNPGGMQIAGAEEQIMGGEGSGAADVMAPSPEVPQPQALRAQVQAARQPALPPAQLPAPPPVQPVSLAVPPAPAPVAVSAAPEQRPPAAPATASGTEVQLAAMTTEAAAMAEWQRLAKKMPDLLAARHPAVSRTDRDGKTFFRLRTGGFTTVAEATSFCTQVKAKGGGCSITSF